MENTGVRVGQQGHIPAGGTARAYELSCRNCRKRCGSYTGYSCASIRMFEIHNELVRQSLLFSRGVCNRADHALWQSEPSAEDTQALALLPARDRTMPWGPRPGEIGLKLYSLYIIIFAEILKINPDKLQARRNPSRGASFQLGGFWQQPLGSGFRV